MVTYVYSLPAILALITKMALLVFSLRSPKQDLRVRLFVAALMISIVMNVIELDIINGLVLGPYLDVIFYYGCLFVFFALLGHLAAWVAFDGPPKKFTKWLIGCQYGYAGLLCTLLEFPPLLIASVEPLHGYTYTRVPGSLYPLVEVYSAATFTIAFLPIRGLWEKENGRLRSQCQIWMLTAVPACLVLLTVLALLHFGIRWFNATLTLPIPMALLMGAIAYCLYNDRIIEPAWYFPFSKTRRLKRQLYANLQAIQQDEPALKSVSELLTKLTAALGCPVWLITLDGKIHSGVGSSDPTIEFPKEELARIDGMAVAHETGAALRERMKQYRVGAIVSLFTHSETARSWLIFGEAFGQRVYTPTDFRTIGKVIRKLAGVFLDGLLRTHVDWKISSEPAIADSAMGSTSAIEPIKGSLHHPLSERLAQYETFLIREALRSCKGNQAKAARLLGLQPNTLHYKLKRLRLDDVPSE
jgi:hypothetical protein